MSNNTVFNQVRTLKWEIVERNKLLSRDSYARETDAILRINNELFAADIKKSRNIDNILATTFYRVYTQLSAFVKGSRYRPMAIFLVDSIDSISGVESLGKQFDKYAPEFSWLIINRAGGCAYKLYNEKEATFVDLNLTAAGPSSGQSAQLGFSDLELWMFKLLFFHSRKNMINIRIKEELQIRNAFQLSKISGVSRRTANKWVNSMRELGFLAADEMGALRLVNLDKFLQQWSGRYNIRDNKSLRYYEYIQRLSGSKEKIIERIRNSKSFDYMITGHAAASLYGLSVTSAESLHIYRLAGDAGKIENELGLIEVDYDSGITVIEPKYSKSIMNGQGIMEKRYIVDLIQLYLDCRALPDRGYEQSEEIRNLLIR